MVCLICKFTPLTEDVEAIIGRIVSALGCLVTVTWLLAKRISSIQRLEGVAMAPPETCPILPPSLPVATCPTQGCHAEDRVYPFYPRMDRQWPAVSLLWEVTEWQIHTCV